MEAHLQKMLQLARAAQTRAYAPYSKFYVGTCLRTSNNNFYAGCNIENVSYSLTLCAEASAIAQMISQGETSIAEVLIVGSSKATCTPCGSCRQRLLEFADKKISVHLCSASDAIKTFTLEELLPHAFDKNILEQAK